MALKSIFAKTLKNNCMYSVAFNLNVDFWKEMKYYKEEFYLH